MPDPGTTHYCEDHFRDWLSHGLSRCDFAKSIAREGRINYVAHWGELLQADVPALEGLFDSTANDGLFAVFLLPRVRTSRGIVRLLQTLSTSGGRWQVSRIPWLKHERLGVALVGLQFRTTSGDLSSVMGFAPLGCMPVTRRAPYVALAAWAGRKLNAHRRSPAGTIGFVDAPVVGSDGKALGKEAHERMWSNTRTRVEELFRDPKEDGLRLKDVAFCLPDSDVAPILG